MNISALHQAAYQPIARIPANGLGKTLNQAGQDFQALSASLSSGDTSGAQSSFDDLKKLLQSAGSIGAANSVKNDFDLLGKALSSGNVGEARKDFQQLQTDVQSIAQHALGHQPGLPMRLPGGALLQSGLSAAKSLARIGA